ncbi:hypothetical protein [Rhizobium sp. NFACC06-2]|uniref:hypothetical protein n=1 Tax=Rhizobium sp. NFACC06-2 TaxID=1566264 RepID=UPI00087621B2|nr:hypothetical protein [Rhizobium sp. NFACC06-2]SCY04420.1 hypothetical protein SAMN03159288_01127 [Rhizobium sp. NFACC06-2]
MFTQITMIDYSRPMAERIKSRKFCGPYRWTPSVPGSGRGFYQASHGLLMDRHGSSLNLRLEEANEHLGHSRLRFTTGYYADPYGEGDTLKPIIARLPRNRGFLAGWTMGEGMAASVSGTIYETEEEAAYAAHSEAEHDAERCREAYEEDTTIAA